LGAFPLSPRSPLTGPIFLRGFGLKAGNEGGSAASAATAHAVIAHPHPRNYLLFSKALPS